MDYRQQKIKPYLWHAIDYGGVAISGILHALDKQEVRQYLHSRELLVCSIRIRHTFFNVRIKKHDLDQITREMATLLRAGLPVLAMLDLLRINWTKSYLCNTIIALQRSVQGGMSFTLALCESGLFEPIDVRLIAAGEFSGKLVEVFQSIIIYRAKRRHLKRNIQKALTYPLTVGAISVLITLGFIFQVIPSFGVLFKQSGVELPAATRHLLQTTQWFTKHWTQIIFIISIAILPAMYAYRTQSGFRKKLHNLLCGLPLLGNFIRAIACARFTRALSLTCASGLTQKDAIACIAGVTGHPEYDAGIPVMCAQLVQGLGLSAVMLNSGLFPAMVIQRIQLAESAGCLNQMLLDLSDDLSDQMDERLDLITRMLEPAIMIGLGFWIFALVIALYLPLFEAGGLM